MLQIHEFSIHRVHDTETNPRTSESKSTMSASEDNYIPEKEATSPTSNKAQENC